MASVNTGFARTADLVLTDYREDSEQLAQFQRKDFSSMDDELASVFSHQRPPLRFVPLVWRVVRDLAPMYVRRPERVFDGVPDVVAQQLGRAFDRAGMDRLMRVLSRQAVAQNLQVVSVDPVGPETATVRVWSPFEVYVEFEDPLEEDIRKASKVCLRTPLTCLDGVVTYGLRVYTQDDAVVTLMDGTSVVRGIFDASERNPFEGVPLRAYRREESTRGLWYPPIAQDLLALQIGINLVLSFTEHICRQQGFTQRTLTGSSAKMAAMDVYTGPEHVTALSGDDLQLYLHDPNPPTDKTLAALDTTMRLFGASNFVDVQSLLSKSTGITGDAKAMERQDQEEARRELERDLEDFETEIANLMLEAMRLRGLPRDQREDVRVRLDYRYVEPRRNDLQAVQAQEGRFGLGLDAPSRVVARELGVSTADAEKIVVDNLREMAELRRARVAAEGGGAPAVPSEGDNHQPGV